MVTSLYARTAIWMTAAFFFMTASSFASAAKTAIPKAPELIRALRDGESKKADKLIRKGKGVNSQDEYGWTPLMYAVLNKDSKKVDQLLAAGANPDLQDKDGITPLIAAIIQMPPAFMRTYAPAMDTKPETITYALVLKGADLNLADNDGNTPLLYATLGGQDQIVSALIQKGADPNRADSRGCTPLYLAAHPDEAIEWAPAAGALRRPFQIRRIRYGVDGTSGEVQAEVAQARKEAVTIIDQIRSRIVSMLKKAGATEPDLSKMKPISQNLSDSMPKKLGTLNEQTRIFLDIVRNSEGSKENDTGRYSLLVCVAPDGTVKNVRVLSGMSNGVSERLQAAAYNMRYQPALKQGVPVEAWDVIEGYRKLRIIGNSRIGSAGINMATPPKPVTVDACSKEDGLTPLMCAARDNEPGLFKKELKRTGDINARDIYGWTALTYSVAQGNYAMTQSLLSRNADPNIPDTEGRSILMQALDSNNNKIVALLISNHADMSVRDNKGRTASGLAWSKANSPAIALLEKAGAPPLTPDDKRMEIYSEPYPASGAILMQTTPISFMEILPLLTNMEPGTYRMKIRVLIGLDGKVQKVRILTGLPHGITAARIKELYSLRYKPAIKDGQPVEAWTNGDYELIKSAPTMNYIR